PGSPEQTDCLMEVVDCGGQALDDVEPLAGLPEIELRPPPDHHDAMVDVGLEDLFQRQDLRLAADEGEVDHAEGLLHLGVMVQLVEDEVFDGIALRLEYDPNAFQV